MCSKAKSDLRNRCQPHYVDQTKKSKSKVTSNIGSSSRVLLFVVLAPSGAGILAFTATLFTLF